MNRRNGLTHAALASGIIASAVFGLTSIAAAGPAINCRSSGQVCDTTMPLEFNSDGPGSEYAIQVKAPTGHCSAVRYFTMIAQGDGVRIVQSEFLNAGQSSYLSLGNNLPRGRHSVTIGAVGKVGGCNTGRLGSWSVDAQATVIPQ
jgi:hypothetical protein